MLNYRTRLNRHPNDISLHWPLDVRTAFTRAEATIDGSLSRLTLSTGHLHPVITSSGSCEGHTDDLNLASGKHKYIPAPKNRLASPDSENSRVLCDILVEHDLHRFKLKATERVETTGMDERKRDSIVAYLQRRMAEFDITPEAIAASIANDQRRRDAVRYRDASGNSWDGLGVAPQWVVSATSAGQSVEHFAVPRAGELPATKRAGVDWRDDPFAGSRLSTVRPAHHQVP